MSHATISLATSLGTSPVPSRCEISQKFFFDAAHTLKRDIEDVGENQGEAEGSRRIHGHTYHAEVSVAGPADPVSGMVVDLGLVRQAIERLRPRLDHHLLDEVQGLGPATLENLAAFVWRALAEALPGLSQVRVWRDGVGDSCTLRAT
jgi:6-pyruvoyltetrahydropterin/6-carboxytetrahydropterin synthase